MQGLAVNFWERKRCLVFGVWGGGIFIYASVEIFSKYCLFLGDFFLAWTATESYASDTASQRHSPTIGAVFFLGIGHSDLGQEGTGFLYTLAVGSETGEKRIVRKNYKKGNSIVT